MSRMNTDEPNTQSKDFLDGLPYHPALAYWRSRWYWSASAWVGIIAGALAIWFSTRAMIGGGDGPLMRFVFGLGIGGLGVNAYLLGLYVGRNSMIRTAKALTILAFYEAKKPYPPIDYTQRP